MKKIFLLFIFPLLLFSYSIDTYSLKLIDKKSEYKNELILFEWEQMSFFLFNKLYANDYNDYRLESTLRNINNKKLKNYFRFKDFFEKSNIKYHSPTIDNDTDFVFFDNKINKVYHILVKANSPKEIFKIMCIAQNSLLYKYSSLETGDVAQMNMLVKELYIDNLNLLKFINKESGRFGFRGCCELSQIMCKD